MAIDKELLSFLWAELSAESRCRRPGVGDRRSRAIAADGWATHADMEDVLEAYDDRLYRLDIWGVADYLDSPRRYVYPKPRFLSATVLGKEVIHATDAAAILVFLEQLGFDVNAASMVDALLPTIQGKERLTTSEFSIIIYSKRKGRHLVELTSSYVQGRLEERLIRATNGCRIQATLIDGQPYKLTVKGPKYRKPRPRKSVTCSYCGYNYMTGDREENSAHRSYHAMIKRVLDPRPMSLFLKAIHTASDPEWVVPSSPIWKHREMYARAAV